MERGNPRTADDPQVLAPQHGRKASGQRIIGKERIQVKGNLRTVDPMALGRRDMACR